MIPLDAQEAIPFLNGNPYQYLAELEALARNTPPIPRQVYADAAPVPTALLLVEDYPHGRAVGVCGFHEAFLQEGYAWLHATSEAFSLGSTEARIFHMPRLAELFQIGPQSCTRSFVCPSVDRVPPITVLGRPLAPADYDAVTHYPQESEPYRPPLPQLFQWFVVEGRGVIYGVIDQGTLLAYVACRPAYGPIWDVDFIHVRADQRSQGLGVQVAVCYARETLRQGAVPYYSSARAPISERTAQRAGFECCRAFYSVDVQRR